MRSASGSVIMASPIVDGIAGHDRQHLRRQAGLVEHVGERERGQRRQLGRLQHHAVVGGDRRRELVAHHVERVVERRDRRDDAEQRQARGVDLAALAVRADVAGVDLAVVLDRELRREGPHVVGAARLVERVLPAQAGFRRDQAGELLACGRAASRRSAAGSAGARSGSASAGRPWPWRRPRAHAPAAPPAPCRRPRWCRG